MLKIVLMGNSNLFLSSINSSVKPLCHGVFCSNVEIIILSLIPSCVPEINQLFSTTSHELRKMVKKHQNANFIGFSHILAPKGLLKPKFFKSIHYNPITKYERDPHLSKIGAKELASTVFDHCTRFVVNKSQ